MICVTGASGTVGNEVVRQLGTAKAAFRAAYFTESKADSAREKGIETVLIDYNSPERLLEAFRGCDKLFLLGPNVINQAELEINAVEAAKNAGVRHIVKLSVMGALEKSFSLAEIHRQVEEAIEASGLDYTFLRPNSFMQNTVTFMGDSIRGASAFYSTSGEAGISHIDVRDIAAVAVRALTEPGHEGKAYTLTGPGALSYDELAAEMSKALGRTISHIGLSPTDMKEGMLAAGTPETIADNMMDLERFFREGGASPVYDDVRLVTGQEPRSFARFAADTAASGAWDLEAKGVSG